MDLTTRVNLVQNLLKTKELPVKTGAALLDINRTSVYYKGTPISQEELDCKLIIDRLHTDNPAWGARQLSAQLKKRGYQVGRRKTRLYMNEMGIDTSKELVRECTLSAPEILARIKEIGRAHV